MRTTIKDIAKKTNLSITTVSMILNNTGNFPEKTRQLVIKTAEELDYVPNALARGLITKMTKTLGLIIPDIRNMFFSTLAKGIEDECRKNGWTLILCNTSDIFKRDLEYIDMLQSKGVDGILYCMSNDTSLENYQELVEQLRRKGIPYIMVDRSYNVGDEIVAKLDHFNGGYLAGNHLLDLGHTKIACITGPIHLQDSRARLEGFKKALNDRNLDVNPHLVIEGSFDIASGETAIDKLKDKEFTAVFAFNDYMAFGAYKGLRKLGFKVPDDISLIGYDNIFLAENFSVPLTTIHQPVNELGKVATNYLINSIKNRSKIEVIQPFEPELIVRESTARLKDRVKI
jgi:LacI family transcriptional regulator